MTQDEIANRLRYSQSTVAIRLRRLKTEGLIQLSYSVDPSKLGLQIVRVDMRTSDPLGILNLFRTCPCFVNAYYTSGKYNLSMFFVSETLIASQALVNKHLRTHPKIEDLEFEAVSNPIKHIGISLNLCCRKETKTPCGVRCVACTYYKDYGCNGCPATFDYQGNVWNKIQK